MGYNILVLNGFYPFMTTRCPTSRDFSMSKNSKISNNYENSDLLEDAVDYELLGLITQEQMAISSNLIENVASRILNEIEKRLQGFDLQKIGVKVVKISPPVKGQVPQVEYVKESLLK